MQYVTGLRCMRCGNVLSPSVGRYVCDCRPNINSDLGTLDVEYDYVRMADEWKPAQITKSRDRSIARYAPLLPISTIDSLPPIPIGNTPLIAASRLGERTGISKLFIKDDGRNPTGSLKDRASAIAVARAIDEGADVVATASTGNAAAALAGLSAAVGQPCVIFVPETAPKAKLAQILVYGSRVLAIRGTYDQAFDLCTEACAEFGWYNRNTGFNPYMTEGKKTVSYEISEQLCEFSCEASASGFCTPDAVIVSVGDGCIIGGVYKGFYDLMQLGWIDRIPRIYGVQSERSDALYWAWQQGLDVPEPVQATTRADSINVNAPRDAAKALRSVRESGGAFLRVSDEEILASIAPLAQFGAVFAEPAGAAAYAGLRLAAEQGLVTSDETVVIINTGSGLKDINSAIEVTGGVESVDPDMIAVNQLMSKANSLR